MDPLLEERTPVQPAELEAEPVSPPLEEEPRQEEERRPRRSRSSRGGGGWSKAAAILAALALLISCVNLYIMLRPEPQEPPPPDESIPQAPTEPTIQYRDRQLPILEGVAVNQYDKECFSVDSQGWLLYEKDGLSAAIGVDVSAYQKQVDWPQVARSGVSFVMLRAGYRGYTKGVIVEDEYFRQNLQGALDAGLQVGVYFFSQATSVWEAEEEAAFVLDLIRDYNVTYPVAFDWEFIAGSSSARTNGMKPEEVTRCAGAFCDEVSKAGYTPVVYFNQDLGYLTYQLDRLTDYNFWLAEYNARPNFYYHFDLWQYSHKGTVPGIEGAVDLNLDFRSTAA